MSWCAVGSALPVGEGGVVLSVPHCAASPPDLGVVFVPQYMEDLNLLESVHGGL